jgi:rfaE bifunctional protein nucleotidyltransferase chain/domain
MARGPRTGVLAPEAAIDLATGWRSAGLKVVFTRGVFDLLHPGHVRFLRKARALGDVLMVGVDADAAIYRGEGARQPINPEHERAEVVAALSPVDAVVIVGDDTAAAIVGRLRPDLLACGANAPAVLDATVQAGGGRVVRLPIEQGYSTAALASKVRSG